MLARNHRLRVGEEGLVGYVTRHGEARIALDVGADAVFFNNPDLPETRSEITLPLHVGTNIIGAFDVQSTMPKAFDASDIALLSTLADQVAIAIENTRLINDAQRSVRELELAQRQYIQEEWGKLLAERPHEGYHYSSGRLAPIGASEEDDLPDVLPKTPTVVYEQPAGIGKSQATGLMVPILVRGQPIGLIELDDADVPRRWGDDEINLAASVADQVGLALENARLLETTQRRAERERLVSEITTKLRATNDPQEILETAMTQLKNALNVRSVHVRVGTDADKGEAPHENS
jgi:GAF domain-containing protein